MPSSYFSNFRTGIQRSTLGKEGGIREYVEVLIGQGKLWFESPRLFQSVSKSSCTDLRVLLRPSTPLAASSELVNQAKTLSIAGTLSRTFSIPSLSGPSFQVCEYHIGCVLAQSSISSNFQSKTLAAQLSNVVVGGCHFYNLTSKSSCHLLSTKSSNNICLTGGFKNGEKVIMSLKNQQQPDDRAFSMYNFVKECHHSCPYIESGLRDFHCLSSCFSAGSAPDVPFDATAHDEQLKSSVDSSEQYLLKTPCDKTLKLISGSCYLPHPDKEDTGGEDAHFVCPEEQAIGVADGVGGWANLGVDAGQYSRELMSNSVIAIKEEPEGLVDPFKVLEKAHSSTKVKGSSTACIIALTDQGLRAINLGDSGFMVVRTGCTIFRFPVQQHNFNFTYQLESRSCGDLPSSGQVFTIPVAPGDVIIAGTDGLFDNLYDNEITAVVVHAIRTSLSPQVTAQKIAALARQRAQDKDRRTPFSTAAQDAGFRYYGGKLDDTTVVVSYNLGAEDAKDA